MRPAICFSPRKTPYSLIFSPRDFRPAAEHDVVLLRAGEVLQRRAERLGRHRPQIDLHAGRQPQRHLRVAPGEDRADAAERRQAVHRRRDVAGDDEKIEVADGFLAAAIAAGGDDLLDGLAALHVGEDFLHVLVGLDPEDSLLGLGGDVQPLQNGRLRLGPKAL